MIAFICYTATAEEDENLYNADETVEVAKSSTIQFRKDYDSDHSGPISFLKRFLPVYFTGDDLAVSNPDITIASSDHAGGFAISVKTGLSQSSKSTCKRTDSGELICSGVSTIKYERSVHNKEGSIDNTAVTYTYPNDNNIV